MIGSYLSYIFTLRFFDYARIIVLSNFIEISFSIEILFIS